MVEWTDKSVAAHRIRRLCAAQTRVSSPGDGGSRVRGEPRRIRVIRFTRLRSIPLAATGKIPPMNENTTHPLSPGPADRNPADGDSADGNSADGSPSDGSPHGSMAALTVLFGLAVALTATPVFLVLGARLQAIQLLWIVAVIWTVAASFVHALWQALRNGDWSEFMCGEIPRNDENLDWSTRTGRYAFMRIRATHEALMRDGDRYLRDHDSDGRP